MWTDPIVDEVRRNREEFAAQFNFDLRTMVKALQKMEKESGRKLVSFAPSALKENSDSNASEELECELIQNWK
ncbi:MAG: hypothetical protein HQL94_02650 [Magnetococcales bacterium]|nr:hypothetical protein [Magnetococcales bacterium]